VTQSKDDPSRTLPMEDAAALGKAVRHRLLEEKKPFLVVVAGDDVGARFRIAGSSVVGRDPDCAVSLRDAGVSWRHVRLDLRDGDVWVVDLGSTNGTMLNDQKVAESKMQAGDKLFVASTALRLDWLDALDVEFHDELERLLSIDDLTGLYSKRRFDTEGAGLVGTALAGGGTVGVLMMDLDGVKRINDAHGHAFGAHAIAESGAVIGRTIASRGIATRWGGDEFSAILPGLDLDATEALAWEIVRAIAAHSFEHEGIRLTPGISVGVACGPEHGESLESLQRWADEALYRAKRAGKGRVSL